MSKAGLEVPSLHDSSCLLVTPLPALKAPHCQGTNHSTTAGAIYRTTKATRKKKVVSYVLPGWV